MKTLIDGTNVSSRSYYYLLDFNDYDNWEQISSRFGVMKLHELSMSEYKELFYYAIRQEFNN